MSYKKTLSKTLGTSLIVATLMLLSPTMLAHTGHSHAHHEASTGVLHTLTTHPLLFGIVGLLLLSALIVKR